MVNTQLQMKRCVHLIALFVAISTLSCAKTVVNPEDARDNDTVVKWDVIQRNGPKPVTPFDDQQKPPVATVASATRPTNPPQIVEYSLPTTRPVNAPQITEVSDSKVRIVWRFAHYGGSGVLSVKEPATSKRTVTVKPADLTQLVAVLTNQLGTSGVAIPLPAENTVVITCEKLQQKKMIELLEKLDVPAPQVEITVKIFEVSNDFDFQTGSQVLANRVGSDNTQSAISTFGAQRFTNAKGPVNGSVFNLTKQFAQYGLSLDVSFEALADAGLIKLVSSPRMTVAVGQTGYLLAGQEVPVQSANTVNDVLTTATQYKPVGVQLYITPQAMGPKSVKLHAVSIVSSISGFAPLPTLNGGKPAGLINPIIDSREAETEVTVGDNETLAISGLRMSYAISREEKVPLLGDIPLLEWLFKNHRSQQKMTDLYFFVTPRVLS